MKKPEVPHARKITHILSHNFWLKVLSLVFAVILWAYVISSSNPTRIKKIASIPVSISGLSDLNAAGFTTREDLTASALTTTVKVSVPVSSYCLLSADTVSASVDVSHLISAATYSLNVKVSFGYGDISLVSVSPSSVDVAIDQLVSANIPVHFETTGTLPDNLIVLNNAPVSSVTIKAASSYVNRISRAIVTVDLSTLRDSYTFNAACKFVDNSNNVVKLKTDYSVYVDMGVETVKSVPVDVASAITNSDKVATNYEYKGIVPGSTNVSIYGPASALSTISSLTFSSLDIAGFGPEDATVALTPILPKGVHLVGSTETVPATLKITEKQTSVTYTKSVTVTGLPTGKTAVISDGKKTVTITSNKALKDLSVTFTLTGGVTAIRQLSSSNFSVELNLSDAINGTSVITPSIVRASGVDSSIQGSNMTQLTVTIQ